MYNEAVPIKSYYYGLRFAYRQRILCAESDEKVNPEIIHQITAVKIINSITPPKKTVYIIYFSDVVNSLFKTECLLGFFDFAKEIYASQTVDFATSYSDLPDD